MPGKHARRSAPLSPKVLGDTMTRAVGWFWDIVARYYGRKADRIEAEIAEIREDLALQDAFLHANTKAVLAETEELKQECERLREHKAFYETLIHGGVTEIGEAN